ncbi:hypothetical protein GP486_001861 [Trichoglossum hirsutum]|uniref:Glycosyltransferase 2-like domain-containing protein n=1 Tax=Trichoglossum hirsutum TaxID=265104 RepID=A0A9P8RSN1_9PEZI|nr:hypothetical protein GP486_001861 [Trichoglossum hirsutum]
MSRPYIEVNSRANSPPAEWLNPRRDSISSASDVHVESGQATPPKAVHKRYVGESASILLPPSLSGPHRYSEVSLGKVGLGSDATIRSLSRQTNESTASLLPPSMLGSRRYSQMSLSEASLGSYELNERVSMSAMDDCKRAGIIVRLHDRDDAEQWKGIKRYIYFFAPFLILMDVALYLVYLAFRLYCIIDLQRRTGISAGPAWIFIGVEFLITIPYLMNNGWAMFALKTRNRPRLRLVGHQVPTVDVFVTCCKEDNEVIMDTVRAACDQDYPLDKFRVIVLDDGKSVELEQMILEASKMWPNLIYMSREKKPGVPHHFKAGNLNYGLEQLTLLPGGSAEFVGALDADMVSARENGARRNGAADRDATADS